MSTSMIDGGTVASSTKRTEPSVAENPRTRRFGINPGVLVLEVSPTLSGRQQAQIPFGVIAKFDTFIDMKVPNWSVDPEDQSEPFVERDLTAKEAIENVKRAAWQSSRDMGFRELTSLTPITDAEVELVVAAVFPALLEVGAACPYEQENTFDEKLLCVACRYDFLKSDMCKARAAAVAGGELLRLSLLDAFKTNLKFFTTKWSEWVAEMGRRDKGENGISVLDDGHLHVMYQIHETQPADKQALALRANQEAQADSFKEGLRELAAEMRSSAPVAPAPAPAINLEDLKSQLLNDPDFRKQLLEEAKQAETDKKPGGNRK